jgi:hypothetical protein
LLPIKGRDIFDQVHKKLGNESGAAQLLIHLYRDYAIAVVDRRPTYARVEEEEC